MRLPRLQLGPLGPHGHCSLDGRERLGQYVADMSAETAAAVGMGMSMEPALALALAIQGVDSTEAGVADSRRSIPAGIDIRC
jgi:hypothetical protein